MGSTHPKKEFSVTCCIKAFIGELYGRPRIKSWPAFESRQLWSAEDDNLSYRVWSGMASADEQQSLHKREEPNEKDLSQSIHHSASNRNIFVTSCGYFGLGSARIEIGDLVVVVPGLELPLILRKRPNSIRHQLLGPAYVHGIMNGEFASGSGASFAQVQIV